RNDFFTGDGDNFSFNGTLFGMMNDACDGTFNRENLGHYRADRWRQSKMENPNFYFGPLSLLLFGAASFLYELMPSGTRGYAPDLETISSFFNAVQQDDGTWVAGEGEKIPDNWTNRVEPYTNSDVTREILAMYLVEPVLFGGNTGPDSFDTLNFGNIEDGKLPVGLDAADTSCLLYQLATQSVPSYLNGVITPTVEALSFVAKQIGPEL
ncbi:Cloroperoxidase, partial [Hortaea werneckii]